MTASVSGGAPIHLATMPGPLARSVGVLLREDDLTIDDPPTWVIEGRIDLPAGALIHSVVANVGAAWASAGANLACPIGWDTGVDMFGNAFSGSGDSYTPYDLVAAGVYGSFVMGNQSYHPFPVYLAPRVTISTPAAKGSRTGAVTCTVTYSIPEFSLYTVQSAD